MLFFRKILTPGVRFKIMRKFVGGSRAARSLGVTVGDGCRIISCNVRSEYDLVTIGSNCTISSDVFFLTHDGTGWLFKDDAGRRFKVSPIEVGSSVFVGARATLMPGVRVGDRCVIAAGSVVTKSVPEGCVVGGNPATVIGKYDDLEKKVLAEWSTSRAADRKFKPVLEI